MQKGISQGGAIILLGIMMIVFFGGVLWFTGAFSVAGVPAPSNADKEKLDGGSSKTCNPEATATLQLAPEATNIFNTSGSEYVTGTARVYSGDHSQDISISSSDYKGTFTLLGTGRPASGSGFKEVSCDETYTVILPASDGVSTSGVVKAKQTEQSMPVTLKSAKQRGLIFRIYDEIAKGYMYSTHDNSTNYVPTGKTFVNTTAPTAPDAGAGLVIGTNGNFKVTLYAKTNTTVATDSTFTDPNGKLLVGVDRTGVSDDDWKEFSISARFKDLGKNVVKVAVPSKIANDGYDDAYEITEPTYIKYGNVIERQAGESVPVYGGSELALTISGDAKDNVDADYDFKIGLFTSGWAKNTADEGAALVYNKDDSSSTYVYTGMTATVKVS